MNKINQYLFILIFFIQSFVFAQVNDCAIGNYWENIDAVRFENEVKQLAISRSSENLGLFCRQELSARYLKANYSILKSGNINSIQCDAITKKSVQAANDKISMRDFFQGTNNSINSLPSDPWKWSLIPMTESRENSIISGLYNKKTCRGGAYEVIGALRFIDPELRSDIGSNWTSKLGFQIGPSEKLQEILFSHISNLLDVDVNEDCMGETSLAVAVGQNQNSVIGKDSFDFTTSAMVGGLCAEMGILASLPECISAVGQIKKMYLPTKILVQPYGDASINIGYVSLMFPNLFLKLLSSEKVSYGLKLSAKFILEKANEVAKGHHLSTHDSLFSDLVNGFTTVGFSKSEAIELSWDSLAVIATSGPNLVYRLSALKIPKVGILEPQHQRLYFVI